MYELALEMHELDFLTFFRGACDTSGLEQTTYGRVRFLKLIKSNLFKFKD